MGKRIFWQTNSQEPEPGVFGSLEPEPEPLEKKNQEPEPLGKKNQEPEPLEKSQEPTPEKNLPAPQPPWGKPTTIIM